MIKNFLYFNGLILLCLVLVLSCDERDTVDNLNSDSHVRFGFNVSEKASEARIGNALNAVSFLSVSITDETGDFVYENERIELTLFDDLFISNPLVLRAGSYNLVAFHVQDSTGKIVFSTPLEGSDLASFVDTPLPINFSIVGDGFTKLEPSVLPVGDSSPSDFGFSNFSFETVETIDFLLVALSFNDVTGGFDFLPFSLELNDTNGNFILESSFSEDVQSVRIEDRYDSIIFAASAFAEDTMTFTLSRDSVMQHGSNALLLDFTFSSLVGTFGGVDWITPFMQVLIPKEISFWVENLAREQLWETIPFLLEAMEVL